MLNVEYQQAITQVLYVLNNTDEKLVNKIPNKFMEFLKQNKLDTYVPNLEYEKSLEEMNLMPKAKTILSIVYVKYFADEKERQQIIKVQEENEIIHQKELNKKYNYDSLFNKNDESKKEATANIIKYEKKNIFSRIFNKIINFFTKK